MVDIDLGKLSAPLEELRTEVDAAYKRLDSQWDRVSKQLSKLPIPIDIHFTYFSNPSGHHWINLEWKKWKGKRRICLVSHLQGNGPEGWEEDETVTPYEEWGGELRINMLQYVPKLFEAAVEQTKAFIEKTHGGKQ